jgi:salicylate 5-hydroxylase small subunit
VVGVPRLLKADGDGWHVEANYAVYRTKLSQPTQVFNVGRTLDHVVRTPEGLRFKSRLVVYDSELIPNSIIYPI